jgi:uncharacterized protein (DUF58 family)
MEFDEVREYQPGDDVRSIDWNVTARQGRPFIKRFHEERELTVFFAVDLSPSSRYGSGTVSMAEVAAEICACLAFSAVRSNDKVGLLLFTDRIELFIPPAKGVAHAMSIISRVLSFKPAGSGTDLAGAMAYLGRVLHKRSVLFLVSDFIGGSDYRREMTILARRHDCVAVTLADPLQDTLPQAGLVEMEDAETGEIFLADTSDARIRAAYHGAVQEEKRRLAEILRKSGVDQLALTAGEDYIRSLGAFLRRRENRR